MKHASLDPTGPVELDSASSQALTPFRHLRATEPLEPADVPPMAETSEKPVPVREGHLAAMRARIRNWGWRRALFWQFMHVLKEYFGFCLNYVRVGADRLDLRDPNPPEVPPGYETFIASKEHFQPFVGKVEFLDQEFVDQAFANDDEATMTLYNGELVAYGFATRVKARVTSQLELHVPKNFRYAYKSWTRDDHRRKNLSRMGAHIRAFHHPKRVYEERSIWIVLVHNYASLLHSYRSPSERGISVGYVGWFSFFGKQIPFNSRKAKWIGLEIRRRGDDRVRQYVK